MGRSVAVVARMALLLSACAVFNASTTLADVSPTDPFYWDAQVVGGSDSTRSSPSFASVFSPQEQTAVAIDRDRVWQRYYDHLMAPSRATPFVVYLTDDDSACTSLRGTGDDDDEDQETDASVTAQCEQHRAHTATVTKFIAGLVTADAFPAPSVLPIVHISKAELPQAFAKHRVPSTPSLMWFPPRSTGKLQRFAHSQTNFLAFPAPTDVASVAQRTTDFLRRSYAQIGQSFPSSSTKHYQSPAALEDSFAARFINALPFLAIGLYAMLLAYERRTAVLQILRSRFTWLVLAQGVLYVSLSGLFHSIIHRVSAFYAHPHYGIYLIHPSGRKQFFLEGLVNGAWSFAISFALFSIVNVMPKVRSRFAREEIFRWALIVVGVAYMCFYMVFLGKHPWLAK